MLYVKRNVRLYLREMLASNKALGSFDIKRNVFLLISGMYVGWQKNVRYTTINRWSEIVANATSIAFGVGYESPNQFSREYARLFGLPPSRDLAKATRDMRVV